MSPPLLRSLMRSGVGVASRVAPRATGRFLFDRFCRPPSPPSVVATTSTRVKDALERFERAEQLLLPVDDEIVVVYRFEAESRSDDRVVLIHGWASRAAFMHAFVDPLLAQGTTVLAVDLPAHGQSDGRSLDVLRAVNTLHALHERCGPWRSAIAHSFGGLVAAALVDGTIAGMPALALDRLVLISAPESVRAVFERFGQFVGMGADAQLAMNDQVQAIAGRPIDAFRGRDQLAHAAIPTLVLHAPEDREVGYRHAEAWAEAGPFVQLVPIPEAGHRRILTDTRAIDETVRFLA